MAEPAADSKDPKLKAACKYIDQSLAGLQTLQGEVCNKKAGDAAPVKEEKEEVGPAADAKPMTQESILSWLRDKQEKNEFLKDAKVAVNDADGSFTIAHATEASKIYTGAVTTNLDNDKDNIAAALDPKSTTETPTKMLGGRRRKRSARRSFRSSKGGRRSRKGKKGGRRSRGCKCSKSCKCRKCRGRTNKRR
jgi:hypothetical protein